MIFKATSESSRPQGERAALRRLAKRSLNLDNPTSKTLSYKTLKSERHSGSSQSLSKAFDDTVRKIKKTSQKMKRMNNDLWSDEGYHELDKKRNQITNEVGGSKPDKSFQKMSVNKITKTVKIATKIMDQAFVKMTRKTTDEYACEAIGSRIDNDSRSDHITSKSTARSSQAIQDPDIITGSSEHHKDILDKLCPDRYCSVITSPAFEKKKGETQMKNFDKLKIRFCSNKTLLRIFRLICREKHTWSKIAPLVAPEILGAACDGDQTIQQTKVSPDMAPDHKNSRSQFNENVILRTVTINVVFTPIMRSSIFEGLSTVLFHVFVYLLGRLPEIPGKRVLRGL